jgi:hypothetical protein
METETYKSLSWHDNTVVVVEEFQEISQTGLLILFLFTDLVNCHMLGVGVFRSSVNQAPQMFRGSGDFNQLRLQQ